MLVMGSNKGMTEVVSSFPNNLRSDNSLTNLLGMYCQQNSPSARKARLAAWGNMLYNSGCEEPSALSSLLVCRTTIEMVRAEVMLKQSTAYCANLVVQQSQIMGLIQVLGASWHILTAETRNTVDPGYTRRL
jgi:hypothetical protein